MFIKQESIEAINFEGLLIHDFTMGQSISASFATIEVPPAAKHREVINRRVRDAIRKFQRRYKTSSVTHLYE